MRKLIQTPILALWAKVSAITRKSQARYKHGCDLQIRKIFTFTKRNYVFLKTPQLRATSDFMADPIVKEECNQPQSRTLGPFCKINAQSHTVTIDKYGIPKNRHNKSRYTRPNHRNITNWQWKFVRNANGKSGLQTIYGRHKLYCRSLGLTHQETKRRRISRILVCYTDQPKIL